MTIAQQEVPFLDVPGQTRELHAELMDAIGDVLTRGAFAAGPAVDAFEQQFAEFCGVEEAVGVNSGTSALHLALRALHVGPGDEVITTPLTFVATAWAISYCGARPVFVDVEPDSLTLDPAKVEAALSPRTRVILPVHLYGYPARMPELQDIADRHGVDLVEDAAQAHGAKLGGRRVGSFGRAACFSFYPGKNLGACGEGGAVTTNDVDLARRVRALRDHAQQRRYHHEELGYNARMDGIQGAVLSVKLPHLDQWNARRRQVSRHYDRRLARIPGLDLPPRPTDGTSAHHLYVIRHGLRDSLKAELQCRSIHTGLHYPVPLHLQPAYRELNHRIDDFPVAERVAQRCLSLPLHERLSARDVDQVCDAIEEILPADRVVE